MEKFLYFIGIDISKATLDFAVILASKILFHYQSSNDKVGIESFIKHLKTQFPEANFQNSLYCMEHTGIYNNHLLNYLHVKKANIWLEHPINIKESLGMIRGKNDKADAARLMPGGLLHMLIKIAMKFVCGFQKEMLFKNWTV